MRMSNAVNSAESDVDRPVRTSVAAQITPFGCYGQARPENDLPDHNGGLARSIVVRRSHGRCQLTARERSRGGGPPG